MAPIYIDGGTFRFSGTYVPVSISGGVYSWYSGFNYPTSQIEIDEDYLYVINTSGFFVVYDRISELPYAYSSIHGGYTCLSINSTSVYLGTTLSGVRYLDKAVISGSTSNPSDLSNSIINNNLIYPYISDTYINNLSSTDTFLGIVTTTGTKIQYMRFDPQGYVYEGTTSGTHFSKCVVGSSDKVYYLSNSISSGYSLNCHYGLGNWSEPKISYSCNGLTAHDFYISEHPNYGNVLFVATNSGILIIDEHSGNTKIIKPELNVTNILVDKGITFDNGVVYASTVTDFYILDVFGQTKGHYSNTVSGSYGLNYSSISDITMIS